MISSSDLGPVRFSHLKAYGRSAAHGLIARTKDFPPTAAMERGTGVHAMLFKTKPVCWYPGPVRRGKEYDKFVADHPEHVILAQSQFFAAQGMVNSIQASKVAMPLLEGEAEETLHFKWYGMDCRVTPDVRGKNFVTELKSCPSSHPERFPWHSLKMTYHAQMQWERMGAAQSMSLPLPNAAYIVAVEYTEPYVVQCFRITDEALIEAEKLLVSWMEKLKVAEASQAWGGYSELIMPLDVPRDNDQLVFGDDDD